MDKAGKVCCLLLWVFWLLLPKFNFWKGDWALDYIGHMSVLKYEFLLFFPNFPDPKSYVVKQVFYTRYQVSIYLWQIRPALKHCKVPKYDDQDCRFLPVLASHLDHIFDNVLPHSFCWAFSFYCTKEEVSHFSIKFTAAQCFHWRKVSTSALILSSISV